MEIALGSGENRMRTIMVRRYDSIQRPQIHISTLRIQMDLHTNTGYWYHTWRYTQLQLNRFL